MAVSEPITVHVHTEPRTNGKGYVVTISAGEDVSKTLTPDKALKHAYAVLQAAHRAAYDAAVVKQLTHIGVQQDHAGQMVNDLREDRPALNKKDLWPLWLEPGVSAFTGEPFIHVFVDGQMVGQWSFADAQAHATAVLGTVAVADLDSAYFLALTGLLNLDENRAHNVVADIANFREAGA